MAWEERNGRRYYYQKRWIGGTCQTHYVGSGISAEVAAMYDDRDRYERIMERLAFEEFKQEQCRLDQAVGDHHSQVRQIVGDLLRQMGFHQHKGQWRKARRMTDEVVEKKQRKVSVAKLKEYLALFDASRDKKKGAPELKALQKFADAHPQVLQALESTFSDVVDGVVAMANSDLATQIHIKGELKALEDELGIKTATPLERLLIQDVTVCWLRLQIIESIYSKAYATGDGVTFAKAAYLENRLSSTRRRYLRALESLARIRGLLVRAGIQVNVAEQQVVVNGRS